MAHHAGHIVVVEDDSTLRNMLTQYLEEHDLPAIGASNRSELNRNIQVDPALIVLDLQLGQDDGLDVLRDLRSNLDVPVIIITGKRTDEIDRVTGLELGADDYILKPFSPRELLARIRAEAATRHYPPPGSRRISVQWLAPGASRPQIDRPEWQFGSHR